MLGPELKKPGTWGLIPERSMVISSPRLITLTLIGIALADLDAVIVHEGLGLIGAVGDRRGALPRRALRTDP